MSWSFYGVGRPAAVLARARTEFDRIVCAEPEQSIKAAVLHALEIALVAMPASAAVDVKASGSQSPEYKDSQPTGKFSNSANFSVAPIYGFIEDDPASMGGA